MKHLVLFSLLFGSTLFAQTDNDSVYSRLKASWANSQKIEISEFVGRTHLFGIAVYYISPSHKRPAVLAIYDESDPIVGNLVYANIGMGSDAARLCESLKSSVVGYGPRHFTFLKPDGDSGSLKVDFNEDREDYCHSKTAYRLIKSASGPDFIIARSTMISEKSECLENSDREDSNSFLYSYFRLVEESNEAPEEDDRF